MSEYLNVVDSDPLLEAEEQAVSSLERLAEMRVDMGLSGVEVGEPSEAAKDMQDMALQVIVIIALRKTMRTRKDKASGLSYEGWDQLSAANALGITHKQLQQKIKQFGLIEPVPDDGQQDMFGEAA